MAVAVELAGGSDMTKCFADGVDAARLDREPFLFEHRLMGHPALELDNLARVIPALPSNQVMYSTRKLSTNSDFEKTFSQRPLDRSIEETIENIRSSDSYIMVSSLEKDESFRGFIQPSSPMSNRLSRRGALVIKPWKPSCTSLSLRQTA
jgi:hypothetical protein